MPEMVHSQVWLRRWWFLGGGMLSWRRREEERNIVERVGSQRGAGDIPTRKQGKADVDDDDSNSEDTGERKTMEEMEGRDGTGYM